MAQIKNLKFNDNVIKRDFDGSSYSYLFDGAIRGSNGISITGGFDLSVISDKEEQITTGSGGIELRQNGGNITFAGKNNPTTVSFYDAYHCFW